MTDIVPERNSAQSTFDGLQPPSSAPSPQSGGVYLNNSANNSAPSVGVSVPTLTGSEDDLLPERDNDGNVELPSLTLTTPNQLIPNGRPRTPEPAIAIQPPPPTPPAPLPPTYPLPNLEEWRSWKINFPWLSFLLVITISFITAILVLDIISRRDSGFAPLATSAPGFLARDPGIERAIWAQGVLYTSFPAFIMTLYRTMWESTVATFADRQPFVDLRKDGGRPAKATIMLDYKTAPALWAYVHAFRNKHYLLSLCMLMSTVLGLLVVPLIAFLFTTDSFTSETMLPVSVLTIFDPYAIVPIQPDLRLSLNSATAMLIQDAHGPPWTDGKYAFPRFLPSMTVGDGNVTIETIAYSSDLDCKYMPESDYTKEVVAPGTPEYPPRTTTILITANDRGCDIEGQISIKTVEQFPTIPDIPGLPPIPGPPQNILSSWPTFTCSPDDGWFRLSILTARHVNVSAGITNFSLISCMASYRMTPGTLIATTGASSEPVLRAFSPHLSNATTFTSDILWRFLGLTITNFLCANFLTDVDADEFMANAYRIAAKRAPDSPLLPEAFIDATSTLWSTTFAVLASTELFKSSNPPMNGTGIYSRDVNRLVVVSPIAYIVIGMLIIVAFLNISLFFYARQESILREEPVGLVGAAGILHKSDLNGIVDQLVAGGDFDGKVTKAMKAEDELMMDRYRFDERQERIVRYLGVGTPRRNWWKSLIEWLRGTIDSNSLLNRLRGR